MVARDDRSRFAVAALALAMLASAPQAALRFGPAETIAPGIDLFRLDQADLLSPPGPVAIQLLRLDPRLVRLQAVLAQDQVLSVETVPSMAHRRGALAAVNAGFFLPTGEPAGLMKIDGTLVSDATLPRGAVAITRRTGDGPVELDFDQVSVSLEIELHTGAGSFSVRADGIDTARGTGQLIWFNRLFNTHTDTTDAGTEWIIRGSPPGVAERRMSAMRTVIPDDGAVLSFGGEAPAGALGQLNAGDTVRVSATYATTRGTSASIWDRASDAIGGAGLLVFHGQAIDEWGAEKLRPGFATERHPRTMIGVDEDGRIWLITVDGRKPDLSMGMSFTELQGLARGLGLHDALNLDGGGSTTMVVRDVVVNHPSDSGGPRKVSNALLVFPASR